MDILVELELRGILGILVITHFLTVHIYIDTRFGAVYAQVHIASVPVGRNLERAAVNAHRIGLGQFRRTRIAGLELIPVVGVNRRAVALHFPVARYFYLFPVSFRIRLLYACGEVFIAVDVVEIPLAV